MIPTRLYFVAGQLFSRQWWAQYEEYQDMYRRTRRSVYKLYILNTHCSTNYITVIATILVLRHSIKCFILLNKTVCNLASCLKWHVGYYFKSKVQHLYHFRFIDVYSIKTKSICSTRSALTIKKVRESSPMDSNNIVSKFVSQTF